MSLTVPAADALHSHCNDAPHKPEDEVSFVKEPTLWEEAKLLLALAGPTILITIGFVVPSFLTASYVGRKFGPLFLDAYTLANLTGNLFSLSLLSGLYSASDTLSPQAFGAGNYREVGLVALRGLCTSFFILVPTNILLFTAMGPMLDALGQDTIAAQYAWEFYIIYGWSLPFYAVWCVVWKFLSAQAILMPLVVITLLASFFVLPISLAILGTSFGFLGSAAALVLFYAFEAVAILWYLYTYQPHHPETWPSTFTWKEVLQVPAYYNFLRLGAGGMMASLEWVYWEAVALVVGLLGIVPLSVHTVPTQITYVFFMFPLGVGIAISNRIGNTLPRNVHHAKVLAVATLITVAIVFGFFILVIYWYRAPIYRIFTNDPEVLAGCEAIWPLVCFYMWVLVMFGISTGIATGLGMQLTLGVWTLLYLWFFGLPATYYFAIFQGQGLMAVWMWLWPPYLAINVTIGLKFATCDWDEIAQRIRIREGLDKEGLESLRLRESFKGPTYGAIA
jgi:MATE family multidrug resistance protein